MALHHRQILGDLPQAANPELELISLGRRSIGLYQLQPGMPVDVIPVSCRSPPGADVAEPCSSSPGLLRWGSSRGGGDRSKSVSRAMAKPMPSVCLLSAVQVLMPMQ